MGGHSDEKAYPKPALTADIVVLAPDPALGWLQVLLIRRASEPFQGRWALPGGFCEPSESIEQAAARELTEETGLQGVLVEQVRAFTAPGRDPRGWVVSVAHLALIPASRAAEVAAGDDASDARWWSLRPAPVKAGGGYLLISLEGEPVGPLAFDHDAILGAALADLRRDADVLAVELLVEPFTLEELATAHAVARLELPVDAKALGERLVSEGKIREVAGSGGEVRYVAAARRRAGQGAHTLVGSES